MPGPWASRVAFVSQWGDYTGLGVDLDTRKGYNEAMSSTPIGFRTMELVSGSPKFKAGTKVLLRVSTEDQTLELIKGFSKETFPLSSISEVSTQTQQQISSRVTATRLLTLGVFALAAKKKQASNSVYLVITANGSDLVLETDKAMKFADQIRGYLPKGDGLSAAAPVPAETVPASDGIPDQIRKLSELKEAGILSEDEFAAKKSELLARM